VQAIRKKEFEIMPFVRISVMRGKSAEYRTAISEAVHQAMVETIDVPQDDRFQVFHECEPDGLIYDPTYLGIERSNDLLILQITMRRGRTVEQKKAFYRRLVSLLAENPGVRSQDVFVNLIENSGADWSFGNGEAQRAEV
jgi:phenylpyruvate tautomerase PptA (4-oxalocrotonate tautomerase family)